MVFLTVDQTRQRSRRPRCADLDLRDAALKFGFVTAEESDRWVWPKEMTRTDGD